MKLEKIKIIAPDSDITHNKSFPIAPSILAYLAALTPKNIDVELIDIGAGQKPNFDDPVDLVCISCMTPMAVKAKQVASEFKKRGVMVAVGGHHPTACPTDVKEFADIVMIGEGEDIYPKMLDDFKNDCLYDFYVCGEWSHLNNLVGKVYQIKERPSLKGLPIPRKDLLKGKYRFDTLQTTRGCPYACDFCSVTRFFGQTVRSRPLEDMAKEIETLGSLFYLLDDNCFGNPKYNMEFFKLLINSGKKRKWVSQGSLSVVNHPNCDEILKLAAESGLCFLMVGIESLDSSNLKDNNITKKIGHKGEPDINFTINAIKKIQSYGIVVWGFLIFGFMDEKPNTFDIAYRFTKETNIVPCPAVVNVLPETKLYYKLKDYLIPGRSYDYYGGPFITHYINNFTPNEIEKGVSDFQIKVYRWRDIIRRLLHTNPKNIMVSLLIQIGMRKVYKEYAKKRQRYCLPDSEQYYAKDFIAKKIKKGDNAS